MPQSATITKVKDEDNGFQVVMNLSEDKLDSIMTALQLYRSAVARDVFYMLQRAMSVELPHYETEKHLLDEKGRVNA